MAITVCPFCGIASEDAHDSQQACINALHQEIDKARQLLESSELRPAGAPERPATAEAGLGHLGQTTHPAHDSDAK